MTLPPSPFRLITLALLLLCGSAAAQDSPASIRLLASSKRTYVGLGGFGIEIVATERLEG
jgi:hypothetical protein